MNDFIKKVLFPSYKRTISVLVLLILALSIPITMRLISQQQDTRQRASQNCVWKYDVDPDGICVPCDQLNQATCEAADSRQSCFWYPGSVEYPKAGCVDNQGNMGSECGGGHCYNDQLTCTTNNLCSRNGCQSDADCVKSSGSGFFCTQEQQGSSRNGCYPAGHNNGAWCAGPNGKGTVDAVCASGYCNPNPINSTCDTPASSGGGASGGGNNGGSGTAIPPTTSTGLDRPSVSGQGYTGGCNSITLTWGAVTGATGYAIRKYSNVGVGEDEYDKQPGELTTSGTSYTLTKDNDGITSPLTPYFFNIYATNGPARSQKSSILAASGTCTATPPTTPNTCTDSPDLGSFCGSKNVTTTCSNGTTTQAPKTGSLNCPQGCNPSTNDCNVPAGSVSLVFNSVSLPGIGSATKENGKNPNPKKTQNLSVALFPQNTQTKGLSGQIGTTQKVALRFSSGSNSYGSDTLTLTGTAGSYTIKVRTDNSLWRSVGTQTLAQGSNTMPSVNLISGDIVISNSIGADDYNAFIPCLTGSCDASTRALADLNDDDKVNELDLNILLYYLKNDRNGD